MRISQRHLKPSSLKHTDWPRPQCPRATNAPVPLLGASQPSALEPRESEVAEAPLPDRADPVAEQRSPCSRRSSRPLEAERASLFWVLAGSPCFRAERTLQSDQHTAGWGPQ